MSTLKQDSKWMVNGWQWSGGMKNERSLCLHYDVLTKTTREALRRILKGAHVCPHWATEPSNPSRLATVPAAPADNPALSHAHFTDRHSPPPFSPFSSPLLFFSEAVIFRRLHSLFLCSLHCNCKPMKQSFVISCSPLSERSNWEGVKGRGAGKARYDAWNRWVLSLSSPQCPCVSAWGRVELLCFRARASRALSWLAKELSRTVRPS